MFQSHVILRESLSWRMECPSKFYLETGGGSFYLETGGGGRSFVRLYDGPDLKLFILVGWDLSFLSVAWPTGVQLFFFSFAPELVSYSASRDLHRLAAY